MYISCFFIIQKSQNKQIPQEHLLRIEVEQAMLEFKPLKTFGQMWGPLCVQRYKFSHDLTVFPGSAAPHVPHSFYLEGAVPRNRSAPHGVLNSCHLLSLGSIQVHSQGASWLASSKRKHVPNHTAKVSTPGELILHRTCRAREIVSSQATAVEQLCRCS